MILVIQHKVHDFDAWKPVFDEQEPLRRGCGCLGHFVVRDSDEPTDLTVLLQFPSREAAEHYLAEPSMESAMQRGGVESTPRFTWVQEAEVAGSGLSEAA
jgi:quinol monooxygenase YgiN